MEYIVPALIQKTISFQRLGSKNVKSYQIYTKTVDDSYASGIRTELIDEIPNPNLPSPVLKKIALKFVDKSTWPLPKDIYIDKDHPFRMIVDGQQLSVLSYTVNKVAKLVTININSIPLTTASVIELEYFQDVIVKSYMVEQDCSVIIKPIFQNTYNYGKHNLIV